VIPVENEILWNRFNIGKLKFPRIPQTVGEGQSVDLADMQELEKYDFSRPSEQICSIDKAIEFQIVQEGMIHGLVGLFQAKLYEGIILSMEDGWRELFIPLPKSIPVKTGDKITFRVSFTPGEYDSLSIEIE
jgi:hypothetical protein